MATKTVSQVDYANMVRDKFIERTKEANKSLRATLSRGLPNNVNVKAIADALKKCMPANDYEHGVAAAFRLISELDEDHGTWNEICSTLSAPYLQFMLCSAASSRFGLYPYNNNVSINYDQEGIVKIDCRADIPISSFRNQSGRGRGGFNRGRGGRGRGRGNYQNRNTNYHSVSYETKTDTKGQSSFTDLFKADSDAQDLINRAKTMPINQTNQTKVSAVSSHKLNPNEKWGDTADTEAETENNEEELETDAIDTNSETGQKKEENKSSVSEQTQKEQGQSVTAQA